METLQSVKQQPISSTSTLGELLCSVREETKLTLTEVSRRSQVAVEQIEEIESGLSPLEPEQLAQVLDSYGVPSAHQRFTRTVVVINLEDGWVSMNATRRVWENQAIADQNLVRYLSMLHQHRGISAGAQIPLRMIDLSLLRAALGLRRPEVRAHLDRSDRVHDRIKENKSLLAVAAAGFTVAAGAIIVVSGAASPARSDLSGSMKPAIAVTAAEIVDNIAAARQREQAGTATAGQVVPQIDIGSAVSVERGSNADVIRTESPPAVTAPGADSRIEIGTALVIERATNQVVASDPTPSPRTERGPPATEATSMKGNN